MNKLKFTRRELYDEVWKVSMQKLSLQFGISDRGLTKICKKYAIPVPGLGYWAKKQAGHRVGQIPLLKIKSFNPEQIVFTVRVPKMKARKYTEEVNAAVLFEQEKQNQVKVNSAAVVTNVVAIQLQQSLTSKCDKEGIIKTKRGYVECLKVTMEQASRALCILDALLRAFHSRGIQVCYLADSKLKVTVFEEVFTILLGEKFEHELTNNESGGQYWKAMPTGRLRLRFESEYESRTFYDTSKYQRLERSINGMLIFLFKASDDNKRLRQAAEERARRREEEHRCWQEQWRLEQIRKNRIEGVSCASDKWAAICRLKEFIAVAKLSANIDVSSTSTKDFIYFTNDKCTREKTLEKYKNNPEGVKCTVLGLKFHISLPEDNDILRLKAWIIISDILIDNKINSFKTIQHGERMSKDPNQRGKDITIYANFNPELDIQSWSHILKQITQSLTNEKIPPGFRTPNLIDNPEKPIAGSNYITYRYEDELEPKARLANRQLLKRMNLVINIDKHGWPTDQKNDLGAKIRVNVLGQLDIPKYQEASSVMQSLESGLTSFKLK